MSNIELLTKLKKQNAARESSKNNHKLGVVVKNKCVEIEKKEIRRLTEEICAKEIQLREHESLLQTVDLNTEDALGAEKEIKNEKREIRRLIEEVKRRNSKIEREKAKVIALEKSKDEGKIDRLTKELSEKDALLQRCSTKLAKRARKIVELKKKKKERRRSSMVDKETIDNLWAEIAEKIKDHDHLVRKLEKRNAQITDLKKKMKALQQRFKKIEKPMQGGLGAVLIKTKPFPFSVRCGDYLNRLVKKVEAMKGFEDGIWEKTRTVSDNMKSGEIELWFNYLGDDIMSYLGVKDLIAVLEKDQNVHNFKIDDQKYLNGVMST